jgi:flagella basal body P-ring formation protein FlgA
MLDNRVAAALGANIGEPGGATTPIDRRLRLQACPQPVEIGEPVAGALAVRCVPLGWRIRVSLVPSAESRQTAAAAPAQRQARAEPVIRRGDQVELVAIASGFTVSTLATAEQDGAPGDRIRVRTERRTAPVIGQVLEDGRVALPGFNGL